MPPVRSSNCADAQGIPFLLTRRFDRRPGCRRPAPGRRWGRRRRGSPGSAVSTWAASRCATPLSGWPDTYRPSISRSSASLCLSSHSSSGTLMVNTASVGACRRRRTGRTGPSPRPSWCRAPSRRRRCAPGTGPCADGPSESNAPALISDSVTFLLQAADVDLVEVVGEVGELALVGARIDQRRNDVGADVAHRAEPEADVRRPPRRSSGRTR